MYNAYHLLKGWSRLENEFEFNMEID
jgi:hypothetical protein